MPAPPTICLMPEGVRIPSSIANLASFREWAHSDDFPVQGRIDYLAGELEVDMSPEDLGTHGTPKGAIYYRLYGIVVEEIDNGIVLSDRSRLSSPVAALSVEPDVVVILDESLRSGRVRLVPKAGGAEGRFVEVEGAADLVVECVSDSSVTKDSRTLLDLYYRAGVREYWLVDARFAEIAFTLHRWTPDGYRVAVGAEGFSPSLVLERSFRLVRRARPHGIGLFRLEDRALPSDTVG